MLLSNKTRQSLVTRLDRVKANLSGPISSFSESYRMLTSEARVLPDYLIIGVQKGGTTSLYKYLRMHPKVKSCAVKEVHFFNRHYERGLSWYQSHFPYKNGDFIVGEATPDYIYHPYAAMRVSETLPSAKFIVLLRNPIDRAFSHYQHNSRFPTYRKKVDSFEKAIALEKKLSFCINFASLKDYRELFSDDCVMRLYTRYSYLRRGIYIDQIKPWFDLFEKEQILVLKAEDLYLEPKKTYQKCLEFLNLESWEIDNFLRFNANYEYSDMHPVMRYELQEFFRPYNKQLSEFLGIDFGWDN